MKFLMISKCGEGAQVLYNIGREGNDVRLYIKEPDYRRNWSGLIKQIDLDDHFLDDDTVVLFDASGMGDLADRMKNSGHYVFGGSIFADNLEEDRAFGLEFMEKCGIKHPKTQEFSVRDLNEAKKYIHEAQSRLVFKPSGDSLPCHLTYCASDSEDLLQFIGYAYRYYSKSIKSFVLQEFIEGDLISTELFFDGKNAIYPANHTIECKKFLNDDLGPSVGCSGNLVWAEFEDCEIVKNGIGKTEDALIEESYCGQLDLNAIVNDSGVYGLEWTPRFGYDSIPSLIRLLDMDTGQFFSDLARGQGEMRLKCEFSAGVRFTIPPYPIEPEHNKAVLKESPNLGIPIRGFEEKDVKNLYFYEIMVEHDDLVHADGMGVLGVASGIDDEPDAAFDIAYEILERAKIPDLQYRTDLGKTISEMYEKIEERENSYA